MTISNGNVSSGSVESVGTPSGSASIWIAGINESPTTCDDGNLVIASSANIQSYDGGNWYTNGGDITLVVGAAFSTPVAGILNISGGSSTGGFLDLNDAPDVFSNSTSSGNFKGGNINVIAFAGTQANSGVISNPLIPIH